MNRINICECISPYAEVEGVCTAYAGCSILNSNGQNRMECGNTSLRKLNATGGWPCQAAYTEVNGACKCIFPNILGQFLKGSSETICACSSKLQPTLFYEQKGVCYSCPVGCICNEFGCIECLKDTLRSIDFRGCPCTPPSVETADQCVCVEPYVRSGNAC